MPSTSELTSGPSMTARIQAACAPYLTHLNRCVADFPWHSKPHYLQWLAQTYFYTRHATHLISLAAARCDMSQQELHYALIAHLREEHRHEELALADLRRLGHSIDEFEEMPVTSTLYQLLYYRIEHESPLAMFGSRFVLEALGAQDGLTVYEKVKQVHGMEGASFLRVHGEEDQEHVQSVFAGLEGINAAEADIVIAAGRQSSTLYGLMLEAIKAAC